MPLVRFGLGSHMYTFPDTLQEYRDNFGDCVPHTRRLPGMDGGFDQFGDEAAPIQIGKVTQAWFLVAETRPEMDALRDAVWAMAAWGKALLWMQPTDPSEAERFCWARVNNIQMPKREHEHTDLFQRVVTVWQVDDPHWYVQGNEAPIWGDGVSKWGDGVSKWGGSAPLQSVSGTETTLATATNNGNAVALPRVTIYVESGQSCQNPTLQRIVNLQVVDEISYNGTLTAGDILEINCRGGSVLLNKADAYANFSYSTPDWLRLPPGNSELKFRMANSTDACKVAVRWYDTYV